MSNTAFYDYWWKNLVPEDVDEWDEKIIKTILNSTGMSREELRNKYVLDVGCGKGKYAWGFSELGCFVYGYDGSEHAIDYASKNINGVFLHADMLEYFTLMDAYDDKSFDIIWCWCAIYWSDFPADAFEYMVKFLKKGGMVCLYLMGEKPRANKFWNKIFKQFNFGRRACLAGGLSRIGNWFGRRRNKSTWRIPRWIYKQFNKLFQEGTRADIFGRFGAENYPRTIDEDEARTWFDENGISIDFVRRENGIFVRGVKT